MCIIIIIIITIIAPPLRYATVTNFVSSDVDTFSKKFKCLKQILG